MDAVLPPQETLAEKVLQNNTGLRALRQKITAAEQKLAAAGKRYGPVIRGELGAHGYARETRSTEPFSAALVLEMSLYSGGRDDAETARARAELMENQALKAKLELELRQQVLELWLEQNTLRRRLEGTAGAGRIPICILIAAAPCMSWNGPRISETPWYRFLPSGWNLPSCSISGC